jgi:hypothetical protein
VTADYTPTTAQVKAAYVRAMRNAFIASEGEHREEFDRWLAARDAEVAAAALREAADMIEDFVDEGGIQTDDAYDALRDLRRRFLLRAAALTPTEGTTDDAR